MIRPFRYTVGMVTLDCRVHGRGQETLICLHGVGSYKEAWDGVVRNLDDRFTTLTFDLRGHGNSTRIRGHYEIDDFVGETMALADHLGFERFHLAGFSLGGLIAQRMALTNPQRIRRLVLLSTVAGRDEEERQQVLSRLEALKAGDAGSHYNASLSRWLTEEFQERNPEQIRMLRRRNAENDPQCYAAAYRVLAETDFGGILDQIRCPTLIATGSDDVGSNPRMAHHMHSSIVGSELRILPRLRHSILVEAPELVAGLMNEFLIGA